MIVHLSACRDLYRSNTNVVEVDKLIEEYNIAGKQLYRLAESWMRSIK